MADTERTPTTGVPFDVSIAGGHPPLRKNLDDLVKDKISFSLFVQALGECFYPSCAPYFPYLSADVVFRLYPCFSRRTNPFLIYLLLTIFLRLYTPFIILLGSLHLPSHLSSPLLHLSIPNTSPLSSPLLMHIIPCYPLFVSIFHLLPLLLTCNNILSLHSNPTYRTNASCTRGQRSFLVSNFGYSRPPVCFVARRRRCDWRSQQRILHP